MEKLFNNQYNREILDSLAEGVFTVDKNFKINFFNKAAEKITGYSQEEVIGKVCKKVFDSNLCHVDCPIGIVLESGKKVFDYNSKIVIKSGVRKIIKLNAATLRNESNEPIGGVISFRDTEEWEKLKKETIQNNFYGIIGQSKAMQDIFQLITEIAESDASVLITGESGTGKEMIANAIQASSQRKNKPFVKINCSVLPPTLLASELFGHVKGAFTDATKDRIGRFEIADGGTIFLDEIAEMPNQTQVQLLRVLQEGTFERLGESITRTTNVRVIAATNASIDSIISDGVMREDLYYRLNVIPIHVPPLRERMEDIPNLATHFLQLYSKACNKNITEFDTSTMDIISSYPWPGNVRELENAIEYCVVRCRNGEVIMPNHLPPSVTKQLSSDNFILNLNNHKKLNKEFLEALMERNKWNRTKAAQEVGIGRTTLWRMLKKYNINSN